MKLFGFAGIPAHGATTANWQQYLSQQGYLQHCKTQSDQAFATSIGGPSVAEEADIQVVVKGTLRWRNNHNHEHQNNPAKQVLTAYQRYGDQFLAYLEGSFAIAIVDLANRRVLLAIDRMGVERLAYHVNGQMISFGTSAEQLARSPTCRFGLNQQALYDFLMLHMVPAPATVFTDVFKLRPGTKAVFANNALSIQHYWKPQFVEGKTKESFPQWKAELHDSLAAAVTSCNPDEHTGAFLSGGLDSSTIAGLLAQVSTTKARTFSIGFGVNAYDELNYARIANKHFDCQPFEYNVTPEDVVAAFPLIAKAYDEPFGNSSAVPTYFCALRAREQGVDHLLAGDGGDEIFGGNERYVRQQVFEHYRRIPVSLRKSVVEPLSRLIPADARLSVLRKLRSYIDQARIPLPERLESWNFIYQIGTSTMLEPDFEHSINPRAPFGVMNEVYQSAPSTEMLHQMLYYDWHYTLSDSDLRKVGTMCELAGVKVSYPMLDQRVVDLSTHIPVDAKIEGMELRSFYKKAMTGFLPDAILTKPKHGFGLPFGIWLKMHKGLGELIYSHLDTLKQRHIVRASFIDKLIADHQQGHASYFGYAIWDLAMLEAWLQAHQQQPKH